MPTVIISSDRSPMSLFLNRGESSGPQTLHTRYIPVTYPGGAADRVVITSDPQTHGQRRPRNGEGSGADLAALGVGAPLNVLRGANWRLYSERWSAFPANALPVIRLCVTLSVLNDVIGLYGCGIVVPILGSAVEG